MTRMLLSFLVMRNPEFRTRVTRKKSHGDKIKSRMSLSCISFFSWCWGMGHAQRIKFKSLWTLSFCALFAFLGLLWFTSLVSFTGSYIEDKPKFFCDCPTDVSLRSPFPTCFRFLSSFFSFAGHLFTFTKLHFGGSLVEILSKKSSDMKEVLAWGRPRFSSKFSPFLSALVWVWFESVFQKWNIDDVRGCTREVIPHGRCVKLRCTFMQVTLIVGIFCTDPIYDTKNLNW